jgi:hypothetical protein
VRIGLVGFLVVGKPPSSNAELKPSSAGVARGRSTIVAMACNAWLFPGPPK